MVLTRLLKPYFPVRFCSSTSILTFNTNYLTLSPELQSNTNEIEILNGSIRLIHDFITVGEEQCLFDEIEPLFKRTKYEVDHWDDAIHGFREKEHLNWNESNAHVISKVRNIAFRSDTKTQMKHVHILDLCNDGYIKPHIDAVRFCGDTIAGLSLLSDSIMRLVHEDNTNLYIDLLLKRRSLYMIQDRARYKYTHEILQNDHSYFNGSLIPKSRRISVICRNEP